MHRSTSSVDDYVRHEEAPPPEFAATVNALRARRDRQGGDGQRGPVSDRTSVRNPSAGGSSLEFAMSKSNRNSGKPWSSTDQRALRDLARQNTPTRVIGLKLGRTEGAVESQAARQGVSLKPTNQSPYNRRSR
jgi:hypothetical protein